MQYHTTFSLPRGRRFTLFKAAESLSTACQKAESQYFYHDLWSQSPKLLKILNSYLAFEQGKLVSSFSFAWNLILTLDHCLMVRDVDTGHTFACSTKQPWKNGSPFTSSSGGGSWILSYGFGLPTMIFFQDGKHDPSSGSLTWGLMFTVSTAFAFSHFTSISTSKCPMLQTIESSFICSKCLEEKHSSL